MGPKEVELNITVQYQDPGMTDWGTINYLTGDNAALSENKAASKNARLSLVEAEQVRAILALKQKADNFAGAWALVFPATKFRVHVT